MADDNIFTIFKDIDRLYKQLILGDVDFVTDFLRYSENNMIHLEVTHDEHLEVYHLAFKMLGRAGWTETKGFIEVIKKLIPASNRSFDANTKIWTISGEQFTTILKPIIDVGAFKVTNKKVAKKADVEDFFYSYSQPAQQAETKESLADKLMALLECSANDLGDPAKLKRLYRAKAMQYHPDRNNGDGSRMSELNSIWSAYNA